MAISGPAADLDIAGDLGAAGAAYTIKSSCQNYGSPLASSLSETEK